MLAAVLDLDDSGRAGGRQLVHPVGAVEDEGVLDPEPDQDVGHPPGERRVGDAERLAAGAGGVAERTEDIEDGAHAQLPAGHRGEAEALVVDGREEEGDPDLLEAAGSAIGRQVDLDPERLEHVGAAAERRGGPVAVLGDPCAAGGGDDRCERRDVEGAERVAAGAAGVEQVLPVDLQRGGLGAKRAGEPGDLLRRLALDPERDHEAGDLGRGRVAAQDQLHRLTGFRFREVLALDQLADGFDHAASLRKFWSSRFPSTVRTDSGWNWTP